MCDNSVKWVYYRVNPLMHTVVVQQQITTIELMKEQSKKRKENKEQKNKNIMYERVNEFEVSVNKSIFPGNEQQKV